MSRGLYIHIPFCHARCGYCDFVTFTGKEDRVEGYIGELCKEIELYGMAPSPEGALELSTVFFGGGTPSILEPRHIGLILETVRKNFMLEPEAEITLEANPESVTEEKARGWRAAGVNRMSLGLQAYDDDLLRAMGRLHSVTDFKKAVQATRTAGFGNLNIDLIYGFPGQSLSSWQRTLKLSIAEAPEHFSLYALKVEEHTPFAKEGFKVENDLQADMYEWAREFLSERGYEQYEISNFAKPGRACRHNLIYWRQQNYLGVGVGAVGCVGNVRWQNHKTFDAYSADIALGRLPLASEERLDERTRKFERLMLGLRLREGIHWGAETDAAWLSHRSDLQNRGLLEEIRPDYWRIPDGAIAFTNQILLPFV